MAEGSVSRVTVVIAVSCLAGFAGWGRREVVFEDCDEARLFCDPCFFVAAVFLLADGWAWVGTGSAHTESASSMPVKAMIFRIETLCQDMASDMLSISRIVSRNIRV